MARKKPAYRRPRYSKAIEALKPGKDIFFPGASHDSIKAIASRVGNSSRPPRIFITSSREGGGVRVREISA